MSFHFARWHRGYLFMLLFMLGLQANASVIFVDSAATAGANNGTSWSDAYTTVQTALTASSANDTIWVAAAIYYPGASGDNAASFFLKKNVVLLGGFEGLNGTQETSASQRNFGLNKCILSGDLDQSGTFTAQDAYHVIDGLGEDTTAVLDGFTVTGGNAVGGGTGNRGAALFVIGAGARINNCILENNFANNFGAAAFISSSSLYLTNCIVRNNSTGPGGQGGALYFAGASFLRIFNTVIADNFGGNLGGGALLGSADTQFINCTFANNSAGTGGGLFSLNAAIQFRNCIFWGNTPTQIAGTNPVVDHCLVQGGFAAGTNIVDGDPNFRDADYRIFACSPAVDAGDSLLSIPADLDGNPRPFDGDGDLTAKWDIGAFENQVVVSFPAANTITGPNPSCALGDDVVYQVTNNNFPTNTYAWNLPGGGGTFDGRTDSNAVAVDWGATTGNFTLEVREISASTGCSDTNSIVITLDTVPVVTMSPTGQSAVCDGDSLQLSASGAGTGFQWYLNGGLIPGATGTQFFAKQEGIHNVVLTNGSGCRDSAAIAFDLVINQLPNVVFTPSSNPEICVGDVQTISGTAGSSYQWFFNGAALPSETAQTISTSTAGLYNLQVTDANTCTDSAAAGIEVIVHPLPVVSISPIGVDTLCAGDSLALTAQAAGDTAWQWYLNGSLIPGATANPFPGNMSGIYNVVLTDSNGCQDSSATGREILIGDFINPQSACHDTTLYLGANGDVNLAPAMIDNGSSDNCLVDSFALSQDVFLCSDTGTTAITLTVFDGALNSNACISQVTVIDSMAPAAICTDTTGYIDGSGQLVVTASLVDGGSSDNCGIATALVDLSNFTCADTGMHVITMTVIDVSGSSSSCTSNLTIADSTRPNAVCQDTAVFLDGGGNASINLSSIENGSSDNCGIASSSLDRTSFTCGDVPGVFVTLTAIDVSGNAGTCQAYVRVQDSVAPVALCQDTVIYIDNSGQAILVPGDVDGGSSDNCGIDLASLSQTNFSCIDTGANAVTLFIQDADTNIATCISNITVLDTIPPVANCSDTLFYLDSTGNAVVDPAIFGINSFDNCLFFDSSYVNVGPYTCADTGQHAVTLVVRDVNGRMDSCSGTVTIADSTAPFVQCRDTSLILDVGGNASITAAALDSGTVDNCSLDTIYLDRYTFTCADVGVNNVLLTAEDVYGNLRQCLSLVTIRDTVAPTAACQNLTLHLDSTGNASIAAQDLNNGSADNCAIDTLIATQLLFACQDTGSNSIQLSVIDADSNVATCSAVVSVLDTISPEAICNDLTLYLDGSGSIALTPALLDAGSSDNCPIDSMILSANSFVCADTGLNVVTLTVLDPSGNSNSCNSNITVIDSTFPTAACADTTLYLDSLGSLVIALNDVAGASFDNCGFDTTFLSQTMFGCSDIGVQSVLVTLTDPSGNTSTCTTNLTILDSLAPTVICTDTTVYLDGGGFASITLAMVDNGSFDGCGIDSRALSQTNFTCTDVGIPPVVLTVTDASGNVDSCIAMITVSDTLPPTAACMQDTLYLDTMGLALVTPARLENGSFDVCGIDTSYVDVTNMTCADIGVLPATLTVVDPSGNLDSCTVSVWVFDTLAPVAICDSIRLQLDATGIAVLTPTLLGPNSADNCAITMSSVSQDTFNCSNFGFQTVTLTLSDQYSNQSSCTGVVEVVDTSGIAAVNVNLGGDTIVCNGDTLFLDAGPGMASYLWSNGATTQITSSSVADTIWVDVVSPAGCVGSDTIVITTRNIPEPNLRTESGELVICQNDSLLLEVDPIYSTYLWTTGSTSPTTTVFSGGTYSVQVTDTGGCTLIRSINIQFVPFPAPNPTITPGDPAFYCEGELLDLDAGPGYFAYLWNTNQTTQLITAFQPGTYAVQVWNGFGCHSKAAPVTVNELSAPQVSVVVSGDTLTTNAGGTYQWALNNIPIPGAIQATYIATQTGDYTVQVTYANGCIRTSNPTSVLVSVESASLILRGLKLYPNPTSGQVNLAPIQPIREAVQIRVTDMFGRELMREGFRNLSRERSLDLSGLPAGVYLMEISASDGRLMHKVVRE